MDVNTNSQIVDTFSGRVGGGKMVEIGRVTDTVPDYGVKGTAGASAQQDEK